MLVASLGSDQLEVIGEILDGDQVSRSWERHSRLFSPTSFLGAEFARVGLVAGSTGGRLCRMFPPSAGERMMSTGIAGRFYGEATNRAGNMIMGKAQFSGVDPTSILGPQVVWSLTAYAVNQHFLDEIDNRLSAIESKLDALIEHNRDVEIAQLTAARQECQRMWSRIMDGGDPGRLADSMSAQKQAIDTAWAVAVGYMNIGKAKLRKAEEEHGKRRAKDEDGLCPSDLAEMWPELFGEEGEDFLFHLRYFLTALATKVQLVLLMAAQEGAVRDADTCVGAYRSVIDTEMTACRSAYGEMQDLVSRLVRFEFEYESTLFGNLSKENIAALKTQRILLDLEDALRDHLDIPFVTTGVPQYEVWAQAEPGGALRVGVERVAYTSAPEALPA